MESVECRRDPQLLREPAGDASCPFSRLRLEGSGFDDRARDETAAVGPCQQCGRQRAAGGLAQLDRTYAGWMQGVRGLDAEALAEPVGPAEGPWAEVSMAALVLHINREVIHHGAEMCLLRDLYATTRP